MLCEHIRGLQLLDDLYFDTGSGDGSSGSSDSSDDDDDDDDDDNDAYNTSIWLQRELMALLTPRFPPAALALDQLIDAEDVTDAGERAAYGA